MEKLKGSWLTVAVVVAFFVMVPRHGVAAGLRLTLVVYDHAHLGEGKLAEVENTTSEIFRRTGVQLVWIEGFGYAAKRRDVLTPAREDPATLVVKLQPESEAARYGVRSVCGGIGFASGAIIFVPRVDRRNTVSDVIRIGHVIAHEIGHVLLGPNAHSIVGIMRGTLLQADWEKCRARHAWVHSQPEPTDPNLDRRARAPCGCSARLIAVATALVTSNQTNDPDYALASALILANPQSQASH